jgi:hypothetical protein
MAHRTQITLSDGQYQRLRIRSQASGVSLAELVRRAIDDVYAEDEPSLDEAIQILDRTSGAWRDRDFDGAEYIEGLRPGLGHRLAKLAL